MYVYEKEVHLFTTVEAIKIVVKLVFGEKLLFLEIFVVELTLRIGIGIYLSWIFMYSCGMRVLTKMNCYFSRVLWKCVEKIFIQSEFACRVYEKGSRRLNIGHFPHFSRHVNISSASEHFEQHWWKAWT